MNTISAREYTVFTPVQLLRNWCEQRPSKQSGLDSSVMKEVGIVCYMVDGGGYRFHFCTIVAHVIVFGLHFKWCTVSVIILYFYEYMPSVNFKYVQQ
jgi:hypothetical protein